MRTFFFTTEKTCSAQECRWQSCPERFFYELQKIGQHWDCTPQRLIISQQNLRLEAPPKNGDLAVLFIGSTQDLNTMVAAREHLEGLKKILVVSEPRQEDGKKYHMLEPRFITQVGRGFTELAAVIAKMTSKKMEL